MKKIAVCAVLAGAVCLFGTHSYALQSPQGMALELPQELRASLPDATLSGQAKLKVWGFEVYQATLWTAPGFAEAAYEQSPLVLELAYLRDFKGADIAKRSMAEMRRQAPMTAAQQAAWEGQMRAIFPDVKAGDRITGVHQPATGAAFWSNGRMLGEVRDIAFAKQFFGIWLSAQTSEPQLRRALLARAQSQTRTQTPTPTSTSTPTPAQATAADAP